MMDSVQSKRNVIVRRTPFQIEINLIQLKSGLRNMLLYRDLSPDKKKHLSIDS